MIMKVTYEEMYIQRYMCRRKFTGTCMLRQRGPWETHYLRAVLGGVSIHRGLNVRSGRST
jgi:hypothetical protein